VITITPIRGQNRRTDCQACPLCVIRYVLENNTGIIVSATAVGLGLFLTYSLLFVLRVRCVLCFTSHVVNLALFGILLTGG